MINPQSKLPYEVEIDDITYTANTRCHKCKFKSHYLTVYSRYEKSNNRKKYNHIYLCQKCAQELEKPDLLDIVSKEMPEYIRYNYKTLEIYRDVGIGYCDRCQENTLSLEYFRKDGVYYTDVNLCPPCSQKGPFYRCMSCREFLNEPPLRVEMMYGDGEYLFCPQCEENYKSSI